MGRLEKGETRKDVIQAAVESGATHAGQIMGIVAGAVRDVTREIGDFATDVFEMREAAQRAAVDGTEPDEPVPADPAGEPAPEPPPPAQNP